MYVVFFLLAVGFEGANEIQRVQEVAEGFRADVAYQVKGSHFRVTLDGKTTIFPDHGSKEVGTGLVKRIKKQLGLK